MRKPTRSELIYLLIWGAVLAAFASLLWLAVYVWLQGAEFTTVKPEEVQSTAVPESTRKEPSIEEQAGPLKVGVSEAQLSLSSGDGQLKMRVWADQALKEGGQFSIDEGALQFTLQDHNTLLLRVSDADYRQESGVAHVSGTLIGSIEGTGQYFLAESLSWDQAQLYVTAEKVRYIGPHVDVTGEKMQIDLATGEVSFLGPVEGAL